MLRRDRDLAEFGTEGATATPGRGRARVRPGRMFDQGDLKYVVLRLLADRPRHGYDIIKAVGDLFGGVYTPSPGTVYPTLAQLASAGYASPTPHSRGRRVFQITDAGRAWLSEHHATATTIFERIARFAEGLLDTPMVELNVAFRRLGRSAYREAARHVNDAGRLREIRDILEGACGAIDALSKRAAGRHPALP